MKLIKLLSFVSLILCSSLGYLVGQPLHKDTAIATSSELISNNPGPSDYPSLCTTPEGSVYAVWQSYVMGDNEIPLFGNIGEEKDHLYFSHFNNGTWQKARRIPKVEGDLYKPVCAVTGDGNLYVVWSQQKQGDWDLWYSIYSGRKWSEPARVAKRRGTDIAPVLKRSPDGNLGLVWQGWNGNNFDIFMVTLKNRNWSEPEAVTVDPGNDWMPDFAWGNGDTLSVVWDSYRNGTYDIYLRQKIDDEWLDEKLIAGSPEFEANASVASDKKGRVWIAYENRGPSWGKDRGYVVTQDYDETNSLLGFSVINVKCYNNGRLFRPLIQPPEQPLTYHEWGGYHAPNIMFDDKDRLWLFTKRPVDDYWLSFKTFGRKIAFAAWENCAFTYDGRFWHGPKTFDDYPTRRGNDFEAALLPDGDLMSVWYADHRHGKWRSTPGQREIYIQEIPAVDASQRPLRLTPDDPNISPYYRAAAEKEAKDVEGIRNYEISTKNEQYHIFRGDLHRHTEISWDGSSEGTIIDLFRYSYDAAALDFVAITDHTQTSGYDQEYTWWRTQKMTDLFHAPPHFISLFGYEWAHPYPHGHRNIIQASRGFRSYPHLGTNKNASIEGLYNYLKRTGGISITHHPGTGGGTDWNNRNTELEPRNTELEPVVEIYQGCRVNYEYEGAPRTDLPNETSGDQLMGYVPEGFVWKAWKKGLNLGVIASSDHISTHISLANVISTNATREGLLNALRKRHTYASTDNIVMDFRLENNIQGDIVKQDQSPTFTIHVRGTTPIEKLVIFKNYKKAKTLYDQPAEVDIQWHDEKPKKGENHYYVRVEQADGELAWSSPIWVIND